MGTVGIDAPIWICQRSKERLPTLAASLGIACCLGVHRDGKRWQSRLCAFSNVYGGRWNLTPLSISPLIKGDRHRGDRGFNRGLGLQVVRLHKLPNHAKSCQMQTKTDSGIAKFNTFALCKRCYAPSFAKESVLWNDYIQNHLRPLWGIF